MTRLGSSVAKPPIQVHKVRGRLLPLTTYDAEAVEESKDGQIYTLKATKHRSPPQHKMYWQIIKRTAEATGKWATPKHLHNDLKMLLGYHKATLNLLTGDVYYTADSIAYQKMDQEEFNKYLDAALGELAKVLGKDPMELLNE